MYYVLTFNPSPNLLYSDAAGWEYDERYCLCGPYRDSETANKLAVFLAKETGVRATVGQQQDLDAIADVIRHTPRHNPIL